MSAITDINDAEAERIWQEVREEFPDDETMQQVHFVRLVHFHQLKGRSTQEIIAFYQDSARNHQLPGT